MKIWLPITFAVGASCAAEPPPPPATEVGVTVLPVASAVTTTSAKHAVVEPTEPVTSVPPGARDPVAAERFFGEARSLMSSNRVEQACALFHRSFELDPAIGTMLNMADCDEKLGNIAGACDAYREVEAQARRLGQDTRGEVARSRAEKLGCR